MIDTKALRQKILDMAIKGKLVPQDPNDEPASVLLERIRAEKQQLIKEGKIKKDKNDSVIFKGDDNRYYEKIGSEVKDITDDLPFEIPDSWNWTRLKFITYNHGQKVPDKKFSYIDIGSIDNTHQKLNQCENIIEPDNAPSRARKIVQRGDILYATVRPYLHNMCIVDKNFLYEPIASTGFAVLAVEHGIENVYLFYFMLSDSFDGYANKSENSKGVAYPAINDDKLYKALIPIPPLEEQARIVKRIEELFVQIDIIDQNQADIDTLYEEFRKRTLTLAIQGKLVPQNPNDEPASVLLERIRAEKKAKLGKKYVDSYIYKGDDNCYYEKVKNSVKEISEEIPFEIPESWRWIRIDSLFQHNTGKALNSSNSQGVLHPYITTSNVYWGHFSLDRVKEMPFTKDEFAKCSIVPGDLLVCEGGDVGRAAIWDKDIPMCIQNHIHRLRTYYPVCTAFYYFAFFVYKSIGLIGGKGIGIQGLSSGALGKLIFPLPPLTEQERIVKQVEIILEKLKDEA